MTIRSRDPWIVFALALAVRIAYLLRDAHTNPAFDFLTMDSFHIDAWARAIAAGNPGDAVYFRGPLVPYLDALVYRLGGGIPGALVLNQIAGAATCGLLLLLARAYFAESVAWVAGVTAALYWPFVYFGGELLTEPIYIALVVASLWQLEQAAARPSTLRWITAGACLGLAALARPTILALVPALPLFLRARTGAWLRPSLILGAACALVLAPATVHNFRAGRAIVPVIWSGGLNFYLGNNPDADGRSALIPGETSAWTGGEAEALAIASAQAGRPLDGVEASRLYARKALDFIASHPADAAALFARKLFLFWEGPERSNEKYLYFFWERFGFGRVPMPGFWLVSPLALAGMIRLWPRRRELSLLYLFVLTHGLGVVAFFVVARYRLPVVPVLIVFASALAVELAGAIRRRDPAGLRTGALAATLFVLVNASYPGFVAARDVNLALSHQTLAKAHRAHGDDDAAVAELQAALEAYRRKPSPYHAGLAEDIAFELGNLLAVRGRCDDAIAALGQIPPRSAHATDARLAFADCAEKTGRIEEARRAYELVLASDPANARAREGAARVRSAIGAVRGPGSDTSDK